MRKILTRAVPAIIISLVMNAAIGSSLVFAVAGTSIGTNISTGGTVTATGFSGNGSALTNLNASNIASGTLATGNGGTGLTSYALGDILYASAANILAALPVGTNGQVLTLSGGVPSWQTNPAGFANPMSTRGDVIIRDASNTTARLGVGGAGTVLSSDGTDVSWAAPAAETDPLALKIANDLSDLSNAATARANLSAAASGANSDITSLSGLTTQLDVPQGGTGATTLTGVLHGNGTAAFNAGNVDLTSEVNNALPIVNGGTNLTSYATGDVLFASAPNVLSALGIGSAGQVLTVAGGVPTWAALGAIVETDPIYGASSWATTTNNSGNWDTAFGWGNHATAGYLTSYTETDPLALKIANNLSDLGNAATARSNLGLGSVAYTWPGADGSAGTVLSTNGAGTLSWSAAGAGTVTNVDMSVPSFLSIAGNPITTTGTLALSYSGTALPVANGGTNNGSLGVTAGGVVYTDGSKLMNTGLGTSGQVLTSNAGAAPTWNTASNLVTGAGTTSAANAASGTITTDTATCAAGHILLGGGAKVTTTAAAQDSKVQVRASYPSSTTVWTAEAVNNANLTGGNTTTVTAYALCSP